MMSELAKDIGEKDAVLFYRMCLEAMETLTVLNKNLELETDYKLRDSIYYASSKKDAGRLKKEYELLNKYEFPVEFIDEKTLKDKYNIDKTSALRTWKDAELNPYKFIRSLINENLKIGVKYYENTSIDLDNIKGRQVYTENGRLINYENIIFR